MNFRKFDLENELENLFSIWHIFKIAEFFFNFGNFEKLMSVTLIFMFSKKEEHNRQLSFDLHEYML